MIPLGYVASSNSRLIPEPTTKVALRQTRGLGAFNAASVEETLEGSSILVLHLARSNTAEVTAYDNSANVYEELGRVQTGVSSSIFAFMCQNASPTTQVGIQPSISEVTQFTQIFEVLNLGAVDSPYGGFAGSDSPTSELLINTLTGDLVIAMLASGATNRAWQLQTPDYYTADPVRSGQMTGLWSLRYADWPSVDNLTWERTSGTATSINVMALRLRPTS